MGLLDKVKDTAAKTAEKAKEGVKAGQEKLGDVKIERKIKELKEELGGAVYAQRSGAGSGDSEALISGLVEQIAAAYAELESDAPSAT